MMNTWIYGIIGAGSVVILACLIFIIFQIIAILHYRAHKYVLPFSRTRFEESSNPKKYDEGYVHSFTYKEVEEFSEGFSNLVGKGCSSYVYKGILSDGTEVAVKKLKNTDAGMERKFQIQRDLLSRLHHQHLINLIGYCQEKTFRMLVLQYAPNGTLDENLHGGEQLSWKQRMRIALGTAYGLSYLHFSCNPPLSFNGAFGSSNIFLTEDYAAKITCCFRTSKRESVSEVKCFIDKDLHIQKMEDGRPKDVYAFGLLLLELISGKRVSTQNASSLINMAKELPHDNDRMADLADPSLKNIVSSEFVSICEIACSCTQEDTSARPNMESVIRMLVHALGIGMETAAPITNPLTLRSLVDSF